MIEVTNSAIIIRNANNGGNTKAFNALCKKFSLYDEVRHERYMFVFTTIDTDIYLPSSIPYRFIESIYPNKQVFFNNKTHKIQNIEIEMVNKPRSQEQIDAIDFLSNKSNSHRMLCVGTGK